MTHDPWTSNATRPSASTSAGSTTSRSTATPPSAAPPAWPTAARSRRNSRPPGWCSADRVHRPDHARRRRHRRAASSACAPRRMRPLRARPARGAGPGRAPHHDRRRLRLPRRSSSRPSRRWRAPASRSPPSRPAFPAGLTPLDTQGCARSKLSVADGADEIDIVITRAACADRQLAGALRRGARLSARPAATRI